VPLVEKQPFQWLMQPLRNYVESSGGFFGSYGTYNEKRTFLLNDSVFVRPVICFESAFPVFSEAVSEGKYGFMAIITNDGWWQSRGGYYQHLMLARLRAIESGMWVVRSANTGVSAVIDPRGNIRAQCDYGTAGAFFFEIPLMK
ncbi:MAG TPA: nitrilase-related carbon-nitrogen hydrolase, partial [Bacteroidales bacterium]|nr:nitrilase-related carbon-nitrogen hydrolase [Bacteroidales bacterium]